MEVTTELISAVIAGLLAILGALAKGVQWVSVKLERQAELTRQSHENQTRRIIESQKERDEIERQENQRREEAQERRWLQVVDEGRANREAFLQGLDDLRKSGDRLAAAHEDYKNKEKA